MAIEVFYANKNAFDSEGIRNFIFSLNHKGDADDNAPETIPQDSFNHGWTKLPVSFYDMQPEEIFALLNGAENPFDANVSPKKQQWIRDNQVGHTSMSVGDIVHITSKVIDRAVNRLDRQDEKLNERWLITLGVGFAKVVFT